MKTSYVRDTSGRGFHERPFEHPLVIAICADCAFAAVSVSPAASDAAIWDHVAALHLPSGVSAGILNREP